MMQGSTVTYSVVSASGYAVGVICDDDDDAASDFRISSTASNSACRVACSPSDKGERTRHDTHVSELVCAVPGFGNDLPVSNEDAPDGDFTCR